MTQNVTTSESSKSTKIMVMYGLFFSSFTLSFVPVSVVSIFAIMFCVCVLAGIYTARVQADEKSMTFNHMTFLIRTFWKTLLVLLMTGVFGLLYFAVSINYQPLEPCIKYTSQHIDALLNDEALIILKSIALECESAFFKKNKIHTLIAVTIALFPIFIYLFIRFSRGWSCIKKDRFIPDHKM